MFDIGTIKLSDFGLSKSLPVNKHAGYDVNATFRLTGETGSYRYMAPEVPFHHPAELVLDSWRFCQLNTEMKTEENKSRYAERTSW